LLKWWALADHNFDLIITAITEKQQPLYCLGLETIPVEDTNSLDFLIDYPEPQLLEFNGDSYRFKGSLRQREETL